MAIRTHADNCLIQPVACDTGRIAEGFPPEEAALYPAHCHNGKLTLFLAPGSKCQPGDYTGVQIDMTAQQWRELTAKVDAFINPIPCLT